MPTVSGNLYFDANLNNAGTAPIPNVPIVLQNTTTNIGLVVLTSATGSFTFNNVPAGTYRLVESWGFPGGVATPGDFATATTISVPIGTDPPVSSIASPPANTNLIQSVSPNTIIPITITTSNVAGLTFRDGPYTEVPIILNDVTFIGGNLVTAAANGIWGTLPAGTAVETRPATAPYPGVVPGFTYSNAIPNDGSYTVTNITNAFGAGFVADHTQGDETGRYQIVNGANPGSAFFTQTINVVPNEFYQFSTWMLNLTGGALPALSYEIRTIGGAIIFQQNAANVSLTSPRTWLELGTFFNVGNNSQIVINLLSQGPFASGNDYAIDDISLIQANIGDILTIQKNVDLNFANVGDTINYELVLKNTGNSTITNLSIIDTIPSGTIFQTGTVKVNGTTIPAGNPNNLTIQSPPMPMKSNTTITVTYKVRVTTIPSVNPIPNSAIANYAFAPQNGGTTVPNAISSNIVSTKVNNGDISTRKLVDKSFSSIGDTISYTIAITNYGNVSSSNIILIDTIPLGTSFINDSLTINNNIQVGANPSPPSGASIGTLLQGATATISFKVLVLTIPTINPITNNATFSYNFIVDPSIPTIKSSGISSNAVATRVNSALLTQTKFVNTAFANVGTILVYTVTFKNTGNVSANTLTFIDTIPNGTSFIPSSVSLNNINQPSLNPTPPGFTISTSPLPLSPNSTLTVSFSVLVTTIPNPNPIPNSATGAYTFTVIPTVPNGSSLSYNTNVVNTQVNNANLGNIIKYTDRTFANCGDIINYTIVVPNTGTTTALNVFFKDTIPNGTAFISNSVFINGLQQIGENPTNGISLPNIVPSATTTITFSVKVIC